MLLSRTLLLLASLCVDVFALPELQTRRDNSLTALQRRSPANTARNALGNSIHPRTADHHRGCATLAIDWTLTMLLSAGNSGISAKDKYFQVIVHHNSPNAPLTVSAGLAPGTHLDRTWTRIQTVIYPVFQDPDRTVEHPPDMLPPQLRDAPSILTGVGPQDLLKSVGKAKAAGGGDGADVADQFCRTQVYYCIYEQN